MSCTLTAVRAILCTPSSLNTQEGALLHFAGVPIHAVDGGSAVHELVEGEVVYLGDLRLSPVVAYTGSYSSHAALFAGGVEGVAFAIVVGETSARGAIDMLLHLDCG